MPSWHWGASESTVVDGRRRQGREQLTKLLRLVNTPNSQSAKDFWQTLRDQEALMAAAWEHSPSIVRHLRTAHKRMTAGASSGPAPRVSPKLRGKGPATKHSPSHAFVFTQQSTVGQRLSMKNKRPSDNERPKKLRPEWLRLEIWKETCAVAGVHRRKSQWRSPRRPIPFGSRRSHK